MKKAEMVCEMARIVKSLDIWIIKDIGKVPIDRLKVEDGEQYSMVMVRAAYKWLNNIKQTTLCSARKYYDCCPPHYWIDLFTHYDDPPDLTEWVLLRDALRKLRVEVVSIKRPDYFKKGKRDAEIKKKKAKAK